MRLAERVGFEPTLQQNCKPDFESGAFDHSATFPHELPTQGGRHSNIGRPFCRNFPTGQSLQTWGNFKGTSD